MPSLVEVIDIVILGTAVCSLVISILRLKKKKKQKLGYQDKKELR